MCRLDDEVDSSTLIIDKSTLHVYYIRGNVRQIHIYINTFWKLKQHDTAFKPKTSAAVNNFGINATSAVLNWLRPKHVVKRPVLMFQVVSEIRRRYKHTCRKECRFWDMDIANNAYRGIPLHYSSTHDCI